jgi:hypothetical protein
MEKRTGSGYRRLAVAGLLAAVSSGAALAQTPPAAGDTYLYRLVNGYNKEELARIRHEVDKVEGGNVTLTVTPDKADGGVARTDVFTREGNWLRHPVESHGHAVEYVFAQAYPAYVFPLDPGKSWSVRVPATVAASGQRRLVRVDGRVMGTERVRVPAGEFDTVKIRRLVYPDDERFTLLETQITEFDWYAPALGRAVRTERRSDWLDTSECGEDGGCDFRGGWYVYELVEAPRAGKPQR